MTTTNPFSHKDFWIKIGWIWSVIFYATLIFAGATTILNSETDTAEDWRILGLIVAYGLWHAGFIAYIMRYHGDGDRENYTAVAFIYLTVTIACWYYLTYSYPIFNFVLFALYAQVFGYIRMRLALPLSVVLTALVAYVQTYESGINLLSFDSPIIWYFIFASAAGISLALFINGIISESANRRHLIEQLQATQAELAAAERREGVLQERERLAREIHDTLAQAFIGVIMHLEASSPLMASQPEKAHHHLTQAEEIARHGLTQARRVVQDLRPEVLESAPLPEAIARVVQKWQQQSDINTHTAVTGEYRVLHPEAEVTLIRATQEALANIQKHAHAQEVRVTLSYMGNVVILDVQDDGMGIEQAAPSTNGGGYGLIAMRQRVEQVGGRLTIESDPEDGTTVAVEIPIL
ncbi:MAG: sensor histidine kinase [Anaerolineales bacterium]|nr:sensor histidine kinase [Anaerolineales bacterium]